MQRAIRRRCQVPKLPQGNAFRGMFASLRDGRLNQENLAENFEQVVQEAGIKAVQNLVRAHGRVDIQHGNNANNHCLNDYSSLFYIENPAIDSDPEEEGLAQEFGDELPDIAPPP